jgi:hypothetical protein
MEKSFNAQGESFMASQCPGCTQQIKGATLYQHAPPGGCGYVGCFKGAGFASAVGCLASHCPKCGQYVKSDHLRKVGSIS